MAASSSGLPPPSNGDHSAPGVGEVAVTHAFVPPKTSAEGVRRVAARLGPESLPDVELLDLHLAEIDREQGLAAADRLIERFGGLAGVLGADVAELMRYVGPQSALNLKLLRELAGRMAQTGLAKRQLLTSTEPVAGYLVSRMRGLPREEFWVLFLDRRNQLIVIERMSEGTVDHAPVYVREVMRRALETGASALILAHNHPAGDPTPSAPDIAMTRAILEAGRALSVIVHDHFIVGSETVASFRQLGLI